MFSLLSLALAGFLAAPAVAEVFEPRQLNQKAKTPIDAQTYNNIAKYPAYSTASYLMPFINPCTPPFGSVMTDYINITSTDTQMTIFRNDADKEIVVGIPGSNSTQDYLTDVNLVLAPYIAPNVSCPTCLVHTGFLLSWNSIVGPVMAAINRQLASYPAYHVVIAGHSLGGGLCSLAYATFNGAKLPLKSAYCSGSPRVGNVAFANFIDSMSGASDTSLGNYFRTTHYNDGVPQLPPQTLALGYVHPRTEFWESAYNSTLEATYRCYGQEPSDCNDSVGQLQGINNAHSTYAGVRYDCMGGYTPGPPNP